MLRGVSYIDEMEQNSAHICVYAVLYIEAISMDNQTVNMQRAIHTKCDHLTSRFNHLFANSCR